MNENIIKVQQHDNGIQLYFTIHKDGKVDTLYNANVKVKFMNRRDDVVLNRTCEVTDAELGECLYTLTNLDTKYVGTYTTEVEVTFSNGVVLSHDNPFTLVIVPEIIPNENRPTNRNTFTY